MKDGCVYLINYKVKIFFVDDVQDRKDYSIINRYLDWCYDNGIAMYNGYKRYSEKELKDFDYVVE